MGSTAYEVAHKTVKDYEEKSNYLLQGTLQPLPNSDFTPSKVYKLAGLGSVFDGYYKARKVTHTVNRAGYDVAVEVNLYTAPISPPKVSTKKAPAHTRKKSDKVYIVRRGDNLWNICKKYCHSPLDYHEVAKVNHIKNPDLIYPNQHIKIPSHLLK